ncbi:MAG: glycosyl hydrolase family 32 [Candidatus Brocadiia bacterium]
MGETLYNGIELPNEWPPRNLGPAGYDPMPVPYLETSPPVIPIDVGRQLFVDDFLIAETSMQRVFHAAEKFENNPVMKPETSLERETSGVFPAAVPKDGGVWWDPAERRFKMWYEAGWCGALSYAVSADGLVWSRPELDVNPPTNQVVQGLVGDSGAVVLDLDSENPRQRYKMFQRECNAAIGMGRGPGNSLVSADGIHWSAPVKTGPVGDRSTMFYNAFRKKWVYSIRSSRAGIGRAREYREHDDFLQGATWTDTEKVFWCGADRHDTPDPEIGDPAQLYNLTAVAYESIMLGLFEIHLGPSNEKCKEQRRPKITELKTAFSRDGFHWHRPDRNVFIEAVRNPDAWDRGYVQSVGGICTIHDDELWFYYTGFAGDSGNATDRFGFPAALYSNGCTGIAKLRRDGFASMHANEEETVLLTRPVTFSGSHLFVNVDNPNGELGVELCDKNGTVLSGFSKVDCLPVGTDSTRVRIQWDDRSSVAEFAGRPVRFRFYLRDGDLYGFWVSGSARGESSGYIAAGGPGFTSNRDL